jgi:hypothetical protein
MQPLHNTANKSPSLIDLINQTSKMTTLIQNTRLARNLLPVIALTVLANASSIAGTTADDRGTSSANDDAALYQNATRSVGWAGVETIAVKVAGSFDAQRIWVRDVNAGNLSPHVSPDADWLKSTGEELRSTKGTLAKKASRFFLGLSLVQAAKDLDPTAAAEAFLSGCAASVAAGARILLTPLQGPTNAQIWMDSNPPHDVPFLQRPDWVKYYDEHPREARCAPAQHKAQKPTKPKNIDSSQALELLNNAHGKAFQSLHSSTSAMESARSSVDNSALRQREVDLTLGIIRTAVDAAAKAPHHAQRFHSEHAAPVTASPTRNSAQTNSTAENAHYHFDPNSVSTPKSTTYKSRNEQNECNELANGRPRNC